MSRRTLLCCFAITIVVLDQVTKQLALTNLSMDFPRTVIDGLFNLVLVFNKGAAFGMFSTWSDGPRRLALLAVTVLAMFVIFRLVLKEVRGDTISTYAVVGILAGALGNLIDRLRFDAVVDFLDFYIGTYHWPAFNVADSAISVGVTLLLIRMLFGPKAAAENSPVIASVADTREVNPKHFINDPY